MSKILWISAIVTFIAANCASSEKKVVCYYSSWATYRSGFGKFDVDDVNVNLCTHVVYTFVGIKADGTVVSLDPYLDLPPYYGRDNFRKFVALKKKNPNLKTMLAVGGWNEGSRKYSVMAANAKLRKTFVDSALNMLLEYGFDGIDIDWEYPNNRDTVNGQADVDNFTQLLKELKAALEPRGLLLSIVVAAVESLASKSYNIPAITRYVDYISIMTYDMYGAWDQKTGHNAPLHKGVNEEVFTVEAALKYWLGAGCPPEKLILGLPLYGRTFTLTNADVNGVGALASGTGIAGPYTMTKGLIGYNEFCDKLQRESWNVRYDGLAIVPYAVQAKNWVSYDNSNSLAAKVEYGLSLGIGGAMIWSIETDDFHALCRGGDFPMLRAINKALGRGADGQSTTTTTTLQPSSSLSTESSASSGASSGATSESSSESSSSASTSESSTSVSTTTSPETSADCKEEGFIPHPENCSKFFYCVTDINGDFRAEEFVCPNDLLWDQSILECNYSDMVKCQ